MIIRMMEELEIEEAHTLIINIYNNCCAKDIAYEGNICFYEGNSIELLLSGFRSGAIKIWGCFVNDELCGVAQIHLPNHFVNLFVCIEYQQVGIGKKLFNTVADYCKSIGAKYLQLEALKSSLSFCKRIGCIATGEQINFRGFEYVPMVYIL